MNASFSLLSPSPLLPLLVAIVRMVIHEGWGHCSFKIVQFARFAMTLIYG